MKKLVLGTLGVVAVSRAAQRLPRIVEHYRATIVLQSMEMSMVTNAKASHAATPKPGVFLDSEV